MKLDDNENCQEYYIYYKLKLIERCYHLHVIMDNILLTVLNNYYR